MFLFLFGVVCGAGGIVTTWFAIDALLRWEGSRMIIKEQKAAQVLTLCLLLTVSAAAQQPQTQPRISAEQAWYVWLHKAVAGTPANETADPLTDAEKTLLTKAAFDVVQSSVSMSVPMLRRIAKLESYHQQHKQAQDALKTALAAQAQIASQNIGNMTPIQSAAWLAQKQQADVTAATAVAAASTSRVMFVQRVYCTYEPCSTLPSALTLQTYAAGLGMLLH
jgi:hypothetical protein